MKLLVVDDDPEMLLMAAFLLERDGRFQVIRALGGAAALESARSHRPHAVLSDFRMAGLDGMGLLEGVRAEKGMENTPFIFCSGKREEMLRKSIGSARLSGFIAKPFNPETLADEVFGLLKGRAA